MTYFDDYSVSADWPADDLTWDGDEIEFVSSCPACGQIIDYCQGHGDIGDPYGAAILERHDSGDHTSCHPDVLCD